MLAWLIFEMAKRGPSEPMSATALGRVQGFLLGVVVMGVVALGVHVAEHTRWQREAVSHGAAAYDPVTGVWYWKESVSTK